MKAARKKRSGPAPRFTDMFNVPIEPELKREIVELAKEEDRRPTDMGRVLWREAIEARRQPAGTK